MGVKTRSEDVNSSPFFTAKAIFQVLDLVLQLGDASGGAGLSLHVSQTTPQLLQLQRERERETTGSRLAR